MLNMIYVVTFIACIKSCDISDHEISLFQLFQSFPLTHEYAKASLFYCVKAVKEVQEDRLLT